MYALTLPSSNHFTSAVSADSTILIEPFKFINNSDGFCLLVSKLWALTLEDDNFFIGLESPTHYGDNLVRYPVANYYKVCVLNPIKISTMCKNNIRKTKICKVDTYIIAKTLIMQDFFRFVAYYDLDLMILKQLGRFHQENLEAAYPTKNTADFLP